MPPNNAAEDISNRARRFGLVLYEDRLIYDAQPGVTDEFISKLESHCRGRLPDDLKLLWRSSFGGSVDYDLEIELGDSIVEFSFTELFYPGSDGYRDLMGWIEHELELAEEVAHERSENFDGRLSYLPFGGFEYADRLYVCVEPGPEYGSVHAWMHGLPPAWVLRLNDDRAGRIADDLPSLFRRLDLASDPFAAKENTFAMGGNLAAILEEIEREDRDLSLRLRELVRGAVIDWPSALADGSVAAKPRHCRLAMRDAIERDDREQLLRLESLGCSFQQRLRADGNALDFALAVGRIDTAEFLFDRGVRSPQAIRNGARTAPAGFVRRLLDSGAQPSGLAAKAAALAGLHESAVFIAGALEPDERARFAAELDPDKAQEKWKAIEMLRDACFAMDRKP